MFQENKMCIIFDDFDVRYQNEPRYPLFIEINITIIVVVIRYEIS